MREIKLRAPCAVTGQLVYFDLTDLGTSNDSFGLSLELNNAEQFTGLHDKNGKEIYEGDIVSTGRWIGKVFMRLGCWYVENYSELGYLHSPVVIGNIHENQELIK